MSLSALAARSSGGIAGYIRPLPLRRPSPYTHRLKSSSYSKQLVRQKTAVPAKKLPVKSYGNSDGVGSLAARKARKGQRSTGWQAPSKRKTAIAPQQPPVVRKALESLHNRPARAICGVYDMPSLSLSAVQTAETPATARVKIIDIPDSDDETADKSLFPPAMRRPTPATTRSPSGGAAGGFATHPIQCIADILGADPSMCAPATPFRLSAMTKRRSLPRTEPQQLSLQATAITKHPQANEMPETRGSAVSPCVLFSAPGRPSGFTVIARARPTSLDAARKVYITLFPQVLLKKVRLAMELKGGRTVVLDDEIAWKHFAESCDEIWHVPGSEHDTASIY